MTSPRGAGKGPDPGDEPEVPVMLRRLWGLSAASRRGRPASLRLADVVAAGLAVADHDGLQAVTMAAVARRLGVTGMALYRYVDSKEQLLVLLQDVAAGRRPPSPQECPGVRGCVVGRSSCARSTALGRGWPGCRSPVRPPAPFSSPG